MTSIKQDAELYEPSMTGNITELDKVSVALQTEIKVFKEGTNDEFRIKTVNVDGQDYRVPLMVLADLKAILKERPDLEFFKVTKAGSGMNTRYTVIPL